MPDKNDWTRMAMVLDAIRETLLDGSPGVFAGSDSVTVKTDTWVETVIELRRAQKQCAAYGEMHCPRVPEMPNAKAETSERSGDSSPAPCSTIHGLHRCERIKGHDGLCECHCGMKWPNVQADAPEKAQEEMV